MRKQSFKKFLVRHHFKLWACAFGVVVAMALAAATTPLVNNSQAQGLGTVSPASSMPGSGLKPPHGSGAFRSGDYQTPDSGSVSSSPQAPSQPPPVPATVCPGGTLPSDAQADCYRPCGGAQACGCYNHPSKNGIACPL